MKIAILLGAGSSVPAGYPSTQEITEHVLSGSRVQRHTDSNYYIQPLRETQPASELPSQAQQRHAANSMVRRLHAEPERYFSIYAGRPTNYEDLFYLADQAFSEETGEMENPAVRGFAAELEVDMAPLIGSEAGMSYGELLNETRNYIADIVWGHCQAGSERSSHLKLFEEACSAGLVASISTLCHDTHAERYLRDRGISLADGFSGAEAGVRYWNGDLFASSKIPFLKLHGSVDWFRLRPSDDSETWYDEKTGAIPPNVYHNRIRAPDRTFWRLPDGRPLLLIGTFNKISEYGGGIFRELHYGFRWSIRDADKLVVCGYSFGDKGINSEIIEWFYASRGRRFIVIHPDLESLVSHARGAIRNKWDEWKESGAVTCIRKKIEDVERDEFFDCV